LRLLDEGFWSEKKWSTLILVKLQKSYFHSKANVQQKNACSHIKYNSTA